MRGSSRRWASTQSGWIARYADLYAPTPMGAVSLGMGRPRDFVGGSSNPLQVRSLAGFEFRPDPADSQQPPRTGCRHVKDDPRERTRRPGTPGRACATALDQAHDLSGQIQTALTAYSARRPTYPNHARIAQPPAATSRSLIQGGFETRIFYTGFGGFDTHGDAGRATPARRPTLFTRLDDAIGAFATDMKSHGPVGQRR